MRTIRTKVYQFSELSEQAKEKAMEWYREGNDCYFVWDDIKYDAKEIGLKIISLDDHRPNKGEFVDSAEETADKILSDHGEECETYKTAKQFLNDRDELVKKYSDGIKTDIVTEENEYDFDKECDELEEEFLRSLLEDYRINYNKDVEHQNSDEAVIEAITINEYEFTKDGERFCK